MGHSKLPWRIEGQDIFSNEKQNRYICSWSGRSADANLIVTAVNVMPIVKKILTVLSSESVGDFVYNIRERAAGDPKCPENSWNHPRVKAWGRACATIKPLLEKLEAVE